MTSKRDSFVERVLDGHARIDELDAEVAAWLEGPQARPLHEVLGLSANELELIASTPDALRYLLHARRFARPLQLDDVRGQRRVRAWALQLVSDAVDPFDLAAVDAWSQHIDAIASVCERDQREPSHA